MAENKEVSGIQGISQDARIHESQKAQAQQRLARMEARQVGSEERVEQASEMMIFNPRDLHKKFQPLNEKVIKQPQPQKTTKRGRRCC